MSAQTEFDSKYISSIEICQQMAINRTTILHAVRDGKLPKPIAILKPNGSCHIQLWVREQVAPIMSEWSAARAERAKRYSA